MYDLKNNGVGYAVSNEAINQYAGTLEKLKAADHRRHDHRPDDAGRLIRPTVEHCEGGRRASGASFASSG